MIVPEHHAVWQAATVVYYDARTAAVHQHTAAHAAADEALQVEFTRADVVFAETLAAAGLDPMGHPLVVADA